MNTSLTAQRQSKKQQAFTLIELLTVVTIMLILMGLSIAAMFYARQQAMISRAKAEIFHIKNAVEEFKLARGFYPDQLTEVASRLPENLDVTRDPWSTPYAYNKLTALSYELYSHGPKTNLTADNILPRD